jgi:hypothetical protein
MGRGRCVQDFGGGSLRGRDHWGDPGVDGRIILKLDPQKVGFVFMDRI